jgi:hypothetical protein
MARIWISTDPGFYLRGELGDVYWLEYHKRRATCPGFTQDALIEELLTERLKELYKDCLNR